MNCWPPVEHDSARFDNLKDAKAFMRGTLVPDCEDSEGGESATITKDDVGTIDAKDIVRSNA